MHIQLCFFFHRRNRTAPTNHRRHTTNARLHLYWRPKHSPGNCGNELVSVRQVAKLSTRPPGYLRLQSELLIKQVPKTWRNDTWITWTGKPESLQGPLMTDFHWRGPCQDGVSTSHHTRGNKIQRPTPLLKYGWSAGKRSHVLSGKLLLVSLIRRKQLSGQPCLKSTLLNKSVIL